MDGDKPHLAARWPMRRTRIMIEPSSMCFRAPLVAGAGQKIIAQRTSIDSRGRASEGLDGSSKAVWSANAAEAEGAAESHCLMSIASSGPMLGK